MSRSKQSGALLQSYQVKQTTTHAPTSPYNTPSHPHFSPFSLIFPYFPPFFPISLFPPIFPIFPGTGCIAAILVGILPPTSSEYF